MENKHSICLKAEFSADVKRCSPVPVNRAIPFYVSREADPEEFLFASAKLVGVFLRREKEQILDAWK